MPEPINPFRKPGHTMLTSALDSVRNATLEDSARELEEIGALIGKMDFKEVAEKFLAYIEEFKKGLLFQNFQEVERDIIEEWERIIELNLKKRTISDELFSSYIQRFARTIRLHKK